METGPPDIAPQPGLPPAPAPAPDRPGREPGQPPPAKGVLGFFLAVLALNLLLGSSAQRLSRVLGLAWTEVFTLLLPAAAAAANRS